MIPGYIREAIQRLFAAGFEGALDADDKEYRVVKGWIEKPYSHRNGEKDHPTVVGDYWFKGVVGHEDEGYDAGYADLVYLDNDRAVWLSGSGSEGWVPLEDVRGQWWGPLVRPWEQG